MSSPSASSPPLAKGGGDFPPFRNEPERDFARAGARALFAAAIEKVRAQIGKEYPLVIAGERVRTEEQITSVSPSNPAFVVGQVASAAVDDARRAVAAAKAAFPAWRDTPPMQRAGILLRTAALLRSRRDELAALEIFEVGKTWREADADVVETIDYLEYYAREMVRLGGPQRLLSPPGEVNTLLWEPRGVAVVIPPWNFPLAILSGMASAALVTGNTVVLKPASQSPVIGAWWVELMREAGIPDGVLNFLPGPGSAIGDFLVDHPDVAMIAFTGSRDVGLRLLQRASVVHPGQRMLKSVIAEMGGKNAIIVDSDADLDDAVLGVVASAFGYAGQKCSACSRVIGVGEVYEPFLNRLVEAVRSIHVGSPEDPATYMGPVVEPAARDRILKSIEMGRNEARVALEGESPSGDGFFIPPVIFADVDPNSKLAQEEIFGPVLSAIRARDFDHALQIANDSHYALTGGLYSRSPVHIERARQEFRVGNLYLNRKITGATVGRQPFGGFRMSGTDVKAGGPDYLQQFMIARTITENTLRRGFAPSD